MVALENTPAVHNMVVCTLCSCYPWPVLGLPPVWYKSAPYRSRAVSEPRAVLADFGVTLGDDVEVRVWDSTAEVRYLVVPMRPAGTEGWDEERARGARHARRDDRHRRAVNGAHDMGGAHGFGPVVPEADEPWFHAEWERRVFAMVIALGAGGQWNIDASRFARENRPPGRVPRDDLLRDLAGGAGAAARRARATRRRCCARDGRGRRRWRAAVPRRARATARGALRGRRPRAHPQHPPAHPHPPAPLRARQGRHGRAASTAPTSSPTATPSSRARTRNGSTPCASPRGSCGAATTRDSVSIDAFEPYLAPA